MDHNRMREKLRLGELVSLKVHGHSMEPRVHDGQQVTIIPIVDFFEIEAGDVVYCKLQGRYFFHLVKGKKRSGDGWTFLIGNNKGRINGWANQSAVFGKLDV